MRLWRMFENLNQYPVFLPEAEQQGPNRPLVFHALQGVIFGSTLVMLGALHHGEFVSQPNLLFLPSILLSCHGHFA
jgi:hypothetical protein